MCAAAQTETLRYSVSVPPGLSLGEGSISSARSADTLKFGLFVDASLPGFAIKDRFAAEATPGLCSVHFSKESEHGTRKSSETLEFDTGRSVVVRQTRGGGKSELPVKPCARDALTALFHLRREMDAGRIPPPQTVFFGAQYELKFDHEGIQRITLGQKQVEADKVIASLTGPVSELTVELFLSREKGRVPLALRVPFALGVLSMELAQ